MQNKLIRIAMIEHGLKQYEVAELLGYSDTHMSRLLRRELPAERQKQIVAIIKRSEHHKNETNTNDQRSI